MSYGSATTKWRIERIRERDGDNCVHCGEGLQFDLDPGADLVATIEHIIPRSRRGHCSLPNLALAHRYCNYKRGSDYMPQEANVPSIAELKRDNRCSICLLAHDSFEAMQLHQLEAHDELSGNWVVR